MSKYTPIYKFLYLEQGDIIYPGNDQDNMTTAEGQTFGMYDYLGQGIIEGWQITWLGCTSSSYAMQQRQALLDAYRTDRFSYLALQYETLNYPVTEADWAQCVVVSPGLGIIDVFHAATENASFFRFTTTNHYYVWAEKNVCTNTEYLCQISAPIDPDEDYDLYNSAIYVGEVFATTVLSAVAVSQITYSERRRELKNAQGDVQRMLQQALVNHVHSGEGDMPSKIKLDTSITINVSITQFSNTFTFTLPSGFTDANYAIPQVYLNSDLLLTSQYQITGSGLNRIIYLQNSVDITSTLQIVYRISPGPNVFITSTLTPPFSSIPLNFTTTYYLTDGSITTLPDGSQQYNIFTWNQNNYSEVDVYLSTLVLSPEQYTISQDGAFLFLGPIVPTISYYTETDVSIKFVTPSVQVTGLLPESRIKSINATAFKRGTVPSFRIAGLDHLGLFRLDEKAKNVPFKKLLDSGDHIHFYPEINSPIQFTDYITYANVVKNVKLLAAEATTVARTIIGTPNGLFASVSSPADFSNISTLIWNTDNGVANRFAENYFGNFSAYKWLNLDPNLLNPKSFWVLSKSKNQFKNLIYLSTNFGTSYRKITLPLDSSNNPVTVNDFIYSIDIFVYTTGEVVLTQHLERYSKYYLATANGLYTSTLTRSQNPLKPVWSDSTVNTTDYATGSINNIAEAVNVGYRLTTASGASEKTFVNYRNLYAACDAGLFVFTDDNGTLFTTNGYYNPTLADFNFVKWLGDEDTSNNPKTYGVVWGDSSCAYFSNSGQSQTVVTPSGDSTTTTVTFYQPLTVSLPYYSTNVAVASKNSNIVIADVITQIDGYTLADGNLVLLKNQTNTSENGLYIWSSASKTLLGPVAVNGQYKYYISYGTQTETEWVDLLPDPENLSQKKYALWFANLFIMTEGDYIVSVALDKSSGPSDYKLDCGYYQSYFVATNYTIYRVLVYNDPAVFPVVLPVFWDYDNYGAITSIQHYGQSDSQNGLLVVFSENGIYKSTSGVFSNSSLATYQRFTYSDSMTPSMAFNATVYDDYSLSEYNGKILSFGFTTTATTAASGVYSNQRVYSNNTAGAKNFTIDLTVLSGFITYSAINNPGSKYASNFNDAFVNIDGVKIGLQNIITEGYFVANSDTQYFKYTQSSGVNPSRLLYETEYKEFYIQPWSGTPLVLAKVNNNVSQAAYSYNSDTGQIVFEKTLSKLEKDAVTVTLTNRGQFISNAGETPHGEVFNITAADAVPASKLNSDFNPLSKPPFLLDIDFDNSLWTSDITVVKITGIRPVSSGSNIQQQFIENVQVSVDVPGSRVYVRSVPTTDVIPAGSEVYIARIYANILGIEDKISLAKSKLTYHFDSVSHGNVYHLYNSLLNVNANMFSYQGSPNETLTGVNRGLKNTIAYRTLSDFDPVATFIGYNFGVDPSSTDVASAPSSINLILSFDYNNNPTFATDKGIWQYIRSSSNWNKVDSVDGSQVIYFANKILKDSTGTTNTYAGTNTGLYFIDTTGYYVQNPLFTDPVLSLQMGSWHTNNNDTKIFEAYGKSTGLSFVLRTNGTILQSDYFENHNIYDIYYNTFFRYDADGNQTEHPAVYLATDNSLWAFTTDVAPGAPGPTSRGPLHTLLVGREMFGKNILRNINKINPAIPGTPVKIFKIKEIPSGGRSTWLAVATSSGVYVVNNWKQCDVGDPNGLNFFPQNLNTVNPTIGHACYTIVSKTNDTNNAIYFVGTDIGVFKSSNRCFDWAKTAKFNNQTLSVSDLKYFTDTSGNGYLLAATNIGVWISDNDGDNWQTIQSYTDTNIQIANTPVFGISLNKAPREVFSTEIDGVITKAFAYLNPSNLTGITTLFANISNGILNTQSSTSIVLNSQSYPGMYGFAFTNTPYVANQNYSLGFTTDGATTAPQVIWGLSSLYDPFTTGYAQTSGGTLTGKDYFFRINLSTGATPTEVIEPVGFYNTSYSIGFASGQYLGASISSSGYLYSNVGILCNVVLDTSKSFEINDTSIITQSGVSTSYLRQAVINSLVPNGVGTNNLYTRLSNGFGTSKLLMSVYGFNNSINDLLFFSSQTSTASDCLSANTSGSFQGYTNDPTLVQSSITYVSNTGRLSKLYDAVQFNTRLQFPAIINGFYAQALLSVDTDFINIQAVKAQYKIDFELFISLNAVLLSGTTYGLYYEHNANVFIWNAASFDYQLVIFEDGTCAVPNNYDPSQGLLISSYGSPAVTFLLSKNWAFSTSLCDLSSTYSDWSVSDECVALVLDQYSNSFKPLVIVGTDGNDNSTTTNPIGVNSSIQVAWRGTGTQLLVISPDNSGNEDKLRTMMEGTDSKLFKYSTYPEQDIKDILYNDDDLNLFTSEWERNYDYDSSVFISYIFTQFTTPADSKAVVEFQWSKDRINFSNFIALPNNTKYYLNQKLVNIRYRISFTEDYSSGARQLPYVSSLYHVKVIPTTQSYLSYPNSIEGQLFETLALASFSNSSSVEIQPIVGRTNSIDLSYYEPVQLNRHSALSNRQSSYRITLAYIASGLQLLPLTLDSNNNEYYIVDSNSTIFTWSPAEGDVFTLFNTINTISVPVNPSSYNVIPESGILIITGISSAPDGTPLWESYTATINYSEKRKTIIGEPTTTYDFKTYYFKYGRVPTDAIIVILVNQEIYKGIYVVSFYDGTVTFAATKEATDYVTVFVKFANNFRAGLQIQSYSASNLALQSFNFTYTALPDQPTYRRSLGSTKPSLRTLPQLSPFNPHVDDSLQVNYLYKDQNSSAEKNSQIQWWRQRTGIEYTIFNPAVNLTVTGQKLTGINTVNIYSVYNQSANPFILSVTLNAGVTTNVVGVVITDRGTGFIGTGTNLPSSVVLSINTSITTYSTIGNIGAAISAFTNAPSYSPGFSTTDNYVRINPSSPIGYANTIGFSGIATLSVFPNYDSRLFERPSDVSVRGVFDARDSVFVTVRPNNGINSGTTYQSNVITILPNYTPSVSNLFITNSLITFNGVSTSLSVSSQNDQSPSYTFIYAGLNYTPRTAISWYKLSSEGANLLAITPSLSSSLINLNDQIYFTAYPGVTNSDGTVGFGVTVSSDVYFVAP